MRRPPISESDFVTVVRLETYPLALIDDPEVRQRHQTYAANRREGWGGRVDAVLPAGQWFEWEAAYFVKRGKGFKAELAVHLESELELLEPSRPDFAPHYDIMSLYKWLAPAQLEENDQ